MATKKAGGSSKNGRDSESKRLAALDPKSSTSTNSAISAYSDTKPYAGLISIKVLSL